MSKNAPRSCPFPLPPGIFPYMKYMLLLVLSQSLFYSCTDSTDTLARIKTTGKIVVGTSADYAPYEFHLVKNGKDTIQGFDMDIVAELAKDLGVVLEIKDLDFDELLPSLTTDKVDIVISGMTPTEERKKTVDFSDIYYIAQQVVLGRIENSPEITSLEILREKTIGTQLYSLQESLVKSKLPEAKLVSLVSIPDLIGELKNKNLDALVVELPLAKEYIKANPDLALAEVDLDSDGGGSAIAIKQGNRNLVQEINLTLDRLISDGSIDAFVVKAKELSGTKKY